MRHQLKLAAVMFLLASLASASIEAASGATLQPASGTLDVGNYRFEGGESLPDLRLHYLTMGAPHRDAAGHVTNAVLLLHGTTGSAEQFLRADDPATLYGPGEPLDTSQFFLVIPDGVGTGASSKPSDGLCGAFPQYGYRDQIALDHLLLAHLGIVHERLVFGTSMGAMEVWLWGERYPTDADALVAVAAIPAPISGRNMLWRQMVIDAITTDPDWHGGHPQPDHPPRNWAVTAAPLFALMTGDVFRLQATIADRAAAEPFETGLVKQELRKASPCDVLRQFESSADYDPRPAIGRLTAPFLAINFADDLLNPPELLNLPQRSNIHAVMISDSHRLYGHETLQHPGAWVTPLARFLGDVPGWPHPAH